MATPLDLFTNIAHRLLKDQYGLSVNCIPISPTNNYTPGVHRLLQVSANICDATLDTPFPLVIRALISSNASGLAITGFTNDNQVNTLSNYFAVDNPVGIPLLVAVRKGFPNFNKLALVTDTTLGRKLLFHRAATNQAPDRTNQVYVVGISNYLGMECWNAYTSTYPRALEIQVNWKSSFWLTNQNGVTLQTNLQCSQSPVLVPAGTWTPGLFLLPQVTNWFTLPSSYWDVRSYTWLSATTNNMPWDSDLSTPEWTLVMSNYFTCSISDDGNVVNYVIFTNLSDLVRVSQLQAMGYVTYEPWVTNRIVGGGPPMGVINQIQYSMGNLGTSADWNNYGSGELNGAAKTNAIEFFRKFINPGASGRNSSSYVMQAPFTPVLRYLKTTTYQINDPCCMDTSDIVSMVSTSMVTIQPFSLPYSNSIMGTLNPYYRPWGGNPLKAPDMEAYNSSLRDPSLRKADDYNFPVNQPLDLSWLGRVHRGTPWQTIYLKSALYFEASRWVRINTDPMTHPTNDWRLVSALLPLFLTNDPLSRVSINRTDTQGWAAVLDGIMVKTNVVPDTNIFSATNVFESVLLQSNQVGVTSLAEAIKRGTPARGYFRNVGEILSVLELSSASPFLNQSDTQVKYGINDEAYELIPSQLLSRLRPDIVAGLEATGTNHVFRLSVYPGHTYQLQESMDLKNWAMITNCTSVEDTLLIPLTIPNSNSSRLYRVLME